MRDAFKTLQVSDLEKYKTAIANGYDVYISRYPNTLNKDVDIKASFYEDKCVVTKKKTTCLN